MQSCSEATGFSRGCLPPRDIPLRHEMSRSDVKICLSELAIQTQGPCASKPSCHSSQSVRSDCLNPKIGMSDPSRTNGFDSFPFLASHLVETLPSQQLVHSFISPGCTGTSCAHTQTPHRRQNDHSFPLRCHGRNRQNSNSNVTWMQPFHIRTRC